MVKKRNTNSLLYIEEDNVYNILHRVRNSPELYNEMCNTISQRACSYMIKDEVSDRWAGTGFYDGDHERLGLALKFIDLEVSWVNDKTKLRSAQ